MKIHILITSTVFNFKIIFRFDVCDKKQIVVAKFSVENFYVLKIKPKHSTSVGFNNKNPNFRALYWKSGPFGMEKQLYKQTDIGLILI